MHACIDLADMPTIHWACAMYIVGCTTHSNTNSLLLYFMHTWIDTFIHSMNSYIVCVVYTYRIRKKVVSLCVYKHGDWLQLHTGYYRYDSINTLVIFHATGAIPIQVGNHDVLTHLRYPVHSSQYYKQRSSQELWTLGSFITVPGTMNIRFFN